MDPPKYFSALKQTVYIWHKVCVPGFQLGKSGLGLFLQSVFTADSDNLIGHIGVGEIIGRIVNFYSETDMVHEAHNYMLRNS